MHTFWISYSKRILDSKAVLTPGSSQQFLFLNGQQCTSSQISEVIAELHAALSSGLKPGKKAEPQPAWLLLLECPCDIFGTTCGSNCEVEANFYGEEVLADVRCAVEHLLMSRDQSEAQASNRQLETSKQPPADSISASQGSPWHNLSPAEGFNSSSFAASLSKPARSSGAHHQRVSQSTQAESPAQKVSPKTSQMRLEQHGSAIPLQSQQIIAPITTLAIPPRKSSLRSKSPMAWCPDTSLAACKPDAGAHKTHQAFKAQPVSITFQQVKGSMEPGNLSPQAISLGDVLQDWQNPCFLVSQAVPCAQDVMTVSQS